MEVLGVPFDQNNNQCSNIRGFTNCTRCTEFIYFNLNNIINELTNVKQVVNSVLDD